MNYCALYYLALVSSIQAFQCIHASQSKVVSKEQPHVLDISKFTRRSNDPDYYRLAYLESSLIPEALRTDPSKLLPGKNEPVKHWLNKKLLEDITNKKTQAQVSIEKIHLRDNTLSYVVTMTNVRQQAKSELLTARIRKDTQHNSPESSQEYVGSLILFPLNKDHDKALAYMLGKWNHLINTYALVPDWGLRVVATPSLFAESHNIKALSKNDLLGSNPTKTLISTKKTTTLRTFQLDEGIDCIVLLRILPRYSIAQKAARLIEGGQTLNFYLPQAEDDKSTDTLQSLQQMAHYMHDLYRHSPMHKDLKPYIPEEETNNELIDALNKKLETLMATPKAHHVVFPIDSLWRHDRYGKGARFSLIEGSVLHQSPYLMNVTSKATHLKLSSLVTLSNEKRTKTAQESLGSIIFTLPIEHKNEFYYFRTGRWFKVDPSRFAAIIRKLRSASIKKTIEALIPYTEEHAKKKTGNEYQELRYNRDVVATWTNKTPKSETKIFLLDRICVKLGESEDTFELADILLYNRLSREIHLIHVKRKESGDLDHHRSQVERSAEFLATNLNRLKGIKVLLRAFIDGFKEKSGIKPRTGTNSHLFVRDSQGKSIDELLTVKTKQSNIGRCKIAVKGYLGKNGAKSFKGREKFLALIGDWLYGTGLYNRDPEKKNITQLFTRVSTALMQKDSPLLDDDLMRIDDQGMKEIISLLYACDEQALFDSFMEGLSQLIVLKKLLLTPGVITESTKKKITIVMAVIDDRAIAGKKTNRNGQGPLFRNQHLWGLDHTRQLVEKRGFNFNLVVINENTMREQWDAFGDMEAAIESPGIATDKGGSIASVTSLNDLATSAETKDEEENDEEAELNILETTSSKESDKAKSVDCETNSDDDQKIAGYYYTSTDINRLLFNSLQEGLSDEEVNDDYERFSLSDVEIPDEGLTELNDCIHRNTTCYALSPVVAELVSATPEETLVDQLKSLFNKLEDRPAPTAILIPYNPTSSFIDNMNGTFSGTRGHWVLLHIRIILETKRVELHYIDSLTSFGIHEFDLLKNFIKEKYPEYCFEIKIIEKALQQPFDVPACGAVVVEQLKKRFHYQILLTGKQTSEEAVNLKKQHQDTLRNLLELEEDAFAFDE